MNSVCLSVSLFTESKCIVQFGDFELLAKPDTSAIGVASHRGYRSGTQQAGYWRRYRQRMKLHEPEKYQMYLMKAAMRRKRGKERLMALAQQTGGSEDAGQGSGAT